MQRLSPFMKRNTIFWRYTFAKIGEVWELRKFGKASCFEEGRSKKGREREKEKRKKRRRRRNKKGRFTFLCTWGGSSPRVSLAARTTQWGINSRDGNALYVCSFPQFAGNSLHPSRQLSTDSYLISEMIISKGNEFLSPLFSSRSKRRRRRRKGIEKSALIFFFSFQYQILHIILNTFVASNSTILRYHKLVNSLQVARELPLICC